MREQHGYLTLAGKQLHVGLYLPPMRTPQTAVLICEPFGEEKRCAYRMLVRLARQLAEQGIATLRMDLSGNGDSGDTHAEATWGQWQAETTQAVAATADLTGATKIAILGARAGALLAAAAAAAPTSTQLATVILAEPILTGADLVNDLERRQKIKDMMSGNANPSAPSDAAGAENTDRDFGGFVVSELLLQQVGAADLCQELPTTIPVHVLRVSGASKFPPAWQPLLDIANASGGSSAIIADKPFWGQLEYYESDLVNNAIAELLAKI